MDSEEKTTIEEVIDHVDPLKSISFQEQEKNSKEITKITNDKDNREVIKWLEKNGEDFDIPHNALALKNFFHKHRERMYQSGYTPNKKELTQDDIVSDVMDDVYDDNEEPEEKEVKDVIDNFNSNSLATKINSFIDNLKIERYDNLYKAKDVIVITGYVWQGQKQLHETLPKKEIRYIKTKRSYFISKSAVLRLLFLSKNKKINGFINSFCRSVIQEACND